MDRWSTWGETPRPPFSWNGRHTHPNSENSLCYRCLGNNGIAPYQIILYKLISKTCVTLCYMCVHTYEDVLALAYSSISAESRSLYALATCTSSPEALNKSEAQPRPKHRRPPSKYVWSYVPRHRMETAVFLRVPSPLGTLSMLLRAPKNAACTAQACMATGAARRILSGSSNRCSLPGSSRRFRPHDWNHLGWPLVHACG